MPSYLAFTPVTNVVSSSDVESTNIHSMKIYEKLALLDNNLGTGNQKNIERAFYYDYMGRIVQVIEKNHLDGISINSTKYDFIGNIQSFHESHQKSSGATPDIKLTNYTYDTRGRMLTESTTVNSQGTATVSYTYDVLGKLTGKTYGNGATESLSYNIQGWLSSKSSAKSGTNLFSMNLLYYNSIRATNKYTGNIVEWQWTQGTASQNSYALSYDKLSRLTNSNRYEGGVATNAFTEKNLTYDKNGNITQLQRYGSTGSLQDNFTYNYNGTTYNGNQLSSISGSVNATYAYDNNGNMTTDGRKNLAITYNVLNLQQTLSQGGTAVANYSWLADGTKCAVADNGSGGFDYLGSLIYTRNGSTRTLESTDFGGGRIVYSGGTYTPYYYITDHLGSVRVITNSSGAIVEQNDYYPFGGKYANGNYLQLPVNKQKFNGKELQTMGSTGFLDYGARMYDDVIGRWGVVDPLGEKLPNWTSYRYAFNNPLRYIDINGLIEWPVKGTSAVNKRDVVGGGYSLKNTVVRTSTYLDRDRPPGASNPHGGIDYRASIGTSFYSLGDGKIVGLGSSKKGGNYITVEYGNGDKVTFRHINSTANGIEVGSIVYEGQILGETGKSGTTNAHLHIDAKDSEGNPIDPENQNYGFVTNEKFFTTYGGDYQKLRNAKETKTNEPFKPEQYTAAKVNTRVSNPWAIIASWLQQNHNIKVTVK